LAAAFQTSLGGSRVFCQSKMFRIAAACLLIASVAANRVHKAVSKHESGFGASCEDLEAMFHDRVVRFQGLLDAHSDESSFNTVTQVRFMMRSYGVVRTLRRASSCAWVVDGNGDDIQQVRSIVATLIDGNPCAETAREILAEGGSAESAEIEIQSVWRAMSVLGNDNCEVTAYEETDEMIHLDDEETATAQLADYDAQAQDNIDEMADAMENDAGGAAFLQTDSDARTQSFRTVMRTLGVVFLMLFLLLACAGTVAIISAVLAFTISQYTVLSWCNRCRDTGLLHAFHAVFFGFVPGAALGFAACSYQLYTQLLPALTAAPANITNVTQ